MKRPRFTKEEAEIYLLERAILSEIRAGSIDPEGISFQSAMADLKDVAINTATKRLNPQPLKNIDNFLFHSSLIRPLSPPLSTR